MSTAGMFLGAIACALLLLWWVASVFVTAIAAVS